MVSDLLFYFFVEFLLNIVCYGAGAIAIALATVGRLKPGRADHEIDSNLIKSQNEFTYTLGGVWLVIILTAIVVNAVGAI